MQIPIWPGAAPDLQPVKGPEFSETSGPNDLIAGKTITGINNVTRPTMTFFFAHREEHRRCGRRFSRRRLSDAGDRSRGL
jgi:hypothetical protein